MSLFALHHNHDSPCLLVFISLPPSLSRTAVLGYGTPQYDRISFIVIITISLGLGLPVLFIAFGAVFVIVKKKPWQNVARLLSGSRSGSYNIVNNDQIQ